MWSLSPQVPDDVHVVSCADNLYGVSDFCSLLIGRLKSVPASGLPDHWFTFLEQIQQVPDRVISFERALGFFKSVSTVGSRINGIPVFFSICNIFFYSHFFFWGSQNELGTIWNVIHNWVHHVKINFPIWQWKKIITLTYLEIFQFE